MAITRKLLVVATLAWVAPLSAHQAPTALKHQKSHCPFERKGAAAAPATAWAPAKRFLATARSPWAVVVEGTPGAAAALGLGRSPVFMP